MSKLKQLARIFSPRLVVEDEGGIAREQIRERAQRPVSNSKDVDLSAAFENHDEAAWNNTVDSIMYIADSLEFTQK